MSEDIPKHNRLEDLALFIQAHRDKITDLDVCEATSRHEIVRSFAVSELENANEAAALIFDVCRQDLQAGRSGLVRFEAIATGAGGKRVGRFAFAIDAGKPEDFTLNDANAATVLIEVLRHNRTLVQLTNGHTEEIFRRMGQQLELAHKQTEAVEKQRLQQFEILELLLSNQAERTIQIERAKSEAKATEKMVNSFTPLVPVVLNRLVAAKTGHQALLPESVKKLLGSIREDQIDKITAGLDPAQQAALMEVMIAYQSEESAEEARANGVPATTPNATGGVG